MKKSTLIGSAAGLLIVAALVYQLLPAPEVRIPAQLPPSERPEHRLLNFEGIANFRDLGGYETVDGRRVKWGRLYRTGSMAHTTDADRQALAALNLTALIDFRSSLEKAEEPHRLPSPTTFSVIEIPILDEGNESMVSDIRNRIENGDFDGFDPDQLMRGANRQFADEFTPQFSQFIDQVQAAQGQPIAWNCSAGKDRTGFAAAVLLRILGVPQAVVMRDYMASKEPSVESRQGMLLMLRILQGEETAAKLERLMGVEEDWLAAAFDEIDQRWGGFDNYVSEGLGLSDDDVERLRDSLLETPDAT
ncbi:MAG: tyrosine-protein phosphatase [Pseudomonadota bacterium]